MPKPKMRDLKKQAKPITADTEKEYLKALKKKRKGYLIDMNLMERERVAQHIGDLYDNVKTKHKEICDKLDNWDETFRMVRKTQPGADSDTPNYTTPITTVALETMHANIMNVIFTPKDIMRVLPTEDGDVPKIKKLDTFGNWSMKNEMRMFENIDRLFHASAKNGECPYLVHWVKEYAEVIERKTMPDPDNPDQPLIDPDTLKPIIKEEKKTKLVYNGPRLEFFSRKDYIQPLNALMDKTPDWEMRKIRMTYDQYLREQLQGKMYPNSIQEIKDWGADNTSDPNKVDYEGDAIQTGKFEKEFIEFYGRLRINAVKSRDDDKTIIEEEELEDEFIAIFNTESDTLCALRENKFPLKQRPIGMDYFMPDDEGRRIGIGMFEFMESIQTSYDALYNQFVFGVIQSNNPFGFFSPMANQRDEPMKIRNGYLFPTSDPKGVNIVKLPSPDQSIQNLLELVQQWAQILFGISAYTSGVESQIDPDAPARKAALVVQQGNVRFNAIIKRKNKTLRDIFKRWYLLYNENMPPNKFMRIAGEDRDNPWKFEKIELSDFALQSIPDFELVGNVLNSNKALEANKKLAIYQILIQNPFFNPSTSEGLLALHSVTKWLIDALDETGLSNFLPQLPVEKSLTPEEENARFLQGDTEIQPKRGEAHMLHLPVHQKMILSPFMLDEIKVIVMAHIQATVQMLQQEVTQQIVLGQSGIDQQAFQQGQQQQPQTPTPTVKTPIQRGGPNAVGPRATVGEEQSPQGQFPLTRVG